MRLLSVQAFAPALDSAIGFEGFVIAKTAEQIESENHPKT
jgi:hypothetical protein